MGIFDFFRNKDGIRRQKTEAGSVVYDELEQELERESEEKRTMGAVLEQSDDDSGFARHYQVELLYAERPEIDIEALCSKMREYTGGEVKPQEKGAGMPRAPVRLEWASERSRRFTHGTMMFQHVSHAVEYEDGLLPGQTFVSFSDEGIDPASLEYALQQSWHWSEARNAVLECRHSIQFSDFCTSKLAYKERLSLFQNALRALVEVAPCEAIVWKMSEQVVHPEAFIEALEQGQFLNSSVNVRMYRVEEQAGQLEMVMDTCGLAALGLPDVQCHFRGMDPDQIGAMLKDFGHYLFHAGDDIEDGETIGETEEQRWRCQHQYALAEPTRLVIDMKPES